mgnify:CR=1 FL=1
MSWQQKLTKKRLLGHTFVKKKRNWMDFGVPGEAIGKALGGILGQKKGNKKNNKKSQLAGWLGGRRGPRQGRFGRTNKQDPARPWPTLRDGRADWTAERNHRPPIQLEGLVRMTWVGQGNWLGLVG